jgi:hypothetical protein
VRGQADAVGQFGVVADHLVPAAPRSGSTASPASRGRAGRTSRKATPRPPSRFRPASTPAR